MRSEDALSLPVRPADPAPVGFPVIASIAPLAAAGVIWAITGSAFALVFAVLSPVVAVASMIDGRRTNRKKLRADTASYSRAILSLRAAVSERHDVERAAARQRTPSVRSILTSTGEASRWRTTDVSLVALGSGAVASGVRVQGMADPEEQRDLREWARTLADAPVTADAAESIGIAGPLALSRAMARGLLVQLCCALPPGATGLSAIPAGGWGWTAALPHANVPVPNRGIEVIEMGEGRSITAASSGATRLVITLAATVHELPPGCGTVVRIHGPTRAEIVRSPWHAPALEFCPELVATEEAAACAATLGHQALAAGLLTSCRPIPEAVALTDLHRRPVEGSPGVARGLDCAIGVGEQGEVRIDLVTAGPHALVGGTTGSGKSELLVTWITSMAAGYPPDQVTFLLVDFKGGAAFGPLRALPHCVGFITDLDVREAGRALASLGAELRYRERVLQGAGARDLARAGPVGTLPRLVIVVDEFATMLDAFPELHALFVDIAARGRSLGVHLILCTQRPSGVVRDALLANCSLRLSLRVNNRADSQAVIGTDAAASLSPALPGRCLVETGAGRVVLCQIATTAEHDILDIAGSASALPKPRRPWLDPLPAVVTEQDVRAVCARSSGYHLGLLDEPERQRYRAANYDPAIDGHLLVVGGARSGKSTLLASLTAQGGEAAPRLEVVPPDVESVWDALASARRRLDMPAAATSQQTGQPVTSPRLLLFDDFDSVYARWGPDHQLAAIDLLTGLLRDGPAVGLHLVITVQRLAGALQALSALCPGVLLLRLHNLQEHLAAGGTASHFDDALPPGGGSWQGARVQLLCPQVTGQVEAGVRTAPPLDSRTDTPLLVVSGAPARSIATLRTVLGPACTVIDLADERGEHGHLTITDAVPGTVVVGDADAWQAQWALLGALRRHAGIAFDGCSLADFRLISRRRDLPPPLAPGRAHLWLLRPNGALHRVSFPAAKGAGESGEDIG